MKKSNSTGKKPLVNRRARFDYELGDTISAGLVLSGPEVRALCGWFFGWSLLCYVFSCFRSRFSRCFLYFFHCIYAYLAVSVPQSGGTGDSLRCSKSRRFDIYDIMLNMSSNIDTLFPLDGAEDLSTDFLDGLIDASNGRVEEYFRSLSDDDRELVQWYLHQGVGPFQVVTYAAELVKGYAIVDTTRSNNAAIESAQEELERLNRFMELYLESDLFPKIGKYNIATYEEGVYAGSVDVLGWDVMSPRLGFMNHRARQQMLAEPWPSYFQSCMDFLHDPEGATDYFDQAAIEKAARARTTEVLD